MQTFIGDNDYRRTLLAEWCRQCGVEIWAYCLMPSHVHLIAVPLCDDSLRRGQGRPRYEVRSIKEFRGHHT